MARGRLSKDKKAKPKNVTLPPVLIAAVTNYVRPPRHNNFSRFIVDAVVEKFEKLGVDPYLPALQEDLIGALPNAVSASDRRAVKLPAKRKVTARKLPAGARLRDVREVAFYEDIQAGTTTGSHSGGAPGKIAVPADFEGPVDFVVKVHGDSMRGLIDDGDLAALTYATGAMNGQVVAALVEGQMMLKLFNAPDGGRATLLSINTAYKPIPFTANILIQGIYQSQFPKPGLAKPARKK